MTDVRDIGLTGAPLSASADTACRSIAVRKSDGASAANGLPLAMCLPAVVVPSHEDVVDPSIGQCPAEGRRRAARGVRIPERVTIAISVFKAARAVTSRVVVAIVHLSSGAV